MPLAWNSGAIAVVAIVVAFVSDVPLVSAGQTGDRLIVAENVYQIAMRHNESFDRSNGGNAVYGTSLLIPAEADPVIGLWDVGQYQADFKGRFKTACKWNLQKGYYLPGNNRFEYTGKTIDECKNICCEVGWCKSFDYGHTGKKCWLSAFVEGASGIAWDSSGGYDYYELDLGESVSQLLVVPKSSSAMSNDLVVGTAEHSGNMYTWIWSEANGKSVLTPLGAYVPVTSTNANMNLAAHKAPVNALIVTGWQSSEPQVITAGYDKTVIVWDVDGTTGIKANSRITGFQWPIWAVAAQESQSKGIFIAGGHSEVTRWSWLGQRTFEWIQSQLLKGHERLVKCLAFDSSLQVLASAGADTKILLWTKKPDGNFQQGAILFDHTKAVIRLNFMDVYGKRLLFSGGEDGMVNVFNPVADETSCSFAHQENYYLPGNNRYVMPDTSLDECKKICCESDWCQSFDYARGADPGGLHGPNTCWLSSWAEGASGINWDGSGLYSYYEIEKRGTKMITIQEPEEIRSFLFMPESNILAIAVKGESTKMLKLTSVTCQDGYSPNFEGTKCVPCRLGYAGTGGQCDVCRAGTYSPKEGTFKCEPCPVGFAASKTETPSHLDEDIMRLDGLPKCVECPPWALRTKTGQLYCEWCPPGQLPDLDRAKCIGITKGHNHQAPWGAKDGVRGPQSWGGNADENSDRFCPRAGKIHETCSFGKENIVWKEQACPMTCMKTNQVNVDGDWNPSGLLTGFRGNWKCAISDRSQQEACNQLTCMGALVKMQGYDWRGQPVKKSGCTPDLTDCSCAEDIREACKGGLLRLRNEQCKSQCNQNWCQKICDQQAETQSMGLFRSDLQENPFSVRSCKARGSTCFAVCQNDNRRLTVGRACGRHDIWDEDDFGPGGKYRVINDQLCGGSHWNVDAIVKGVCESGVQENWALYRPAACVASGAIQQFGSLHAAAVLLAAASALATQ